MDNKELQNAILKVAKEIHKICEEHDIKYIMMGGTFIGAIRHKGFIPWDDDIDFGMTYDQYVKFIEIAKSIKHPWLEFDFPEVENKDYANMFIKAYDKNTTFIEVHKENDIRGVFVDIFPIVSCKDTKEECWKELKRSLLLRKVLQSKKYSLYPHKPILQFFVNISISFIKKSWIIRLAQAQINKLKEQKAKYYIAPDGTKKDVYLSSYIEDKYVLYDFEDTQFWGVRDYHGFLTDVFKDYMRLPPEEKRVSHHLVFFNPNLPYREYVKR